MEDNNNFIHKDYLRSFGRVRGRKLSPVQQDLIDNFLPKISIDIEDKNLPLSLFDNDKEIWVEIGFGNGRHLLHQAKINPDVNFIGCEPFVNGVASTIAAMKKDNLTNIRIFNGDVRLLLEKFADHKIDKIFILFPDPWPKQKQKRKRIISHKFLDLMADVLKENGAVQLATDDEDYANWIEKHFAENKNFTMSKATIENKYAQPKDWVKTNYQIKALTEGRKSCFLLYDRKFC